MADGEWVHSLTCAWYTEQASSTRAINRMPRKLSRDLCGDGIRFSGAITRLTRLTYLQVYFSKKPIEIDDIYLQTWMPMKSNILILCKLSLDLCEI